MSSASAKSARHKYDLLVEMTQYLNGLRDELNQIQILSDWSIRSCYHEKARLRLRSIYEGFEQASEQVFDFYHRECLTAITRWPNDAGTQERKEHLDKVMCEMRAVVMYEARDLKGSVAENDMRDLMELIEYEGPVDDYEGDD